ncbi:MCE family protein [Pseudonocardia sp. KRD-184]|uniref:MCE family protein n=1 Tax=Pseudonocardia oceani TaxID=2792013 RepID=A0ABS6U2I2_9PSEU|nr:MlaD family protein [Pseudonocardia oceani]MBW0089264.1 MCE family protein [Pseudonocardia oceani]MBW0094981.1 MCE family protein [Pseudonocardia oceani]MBW0107813.1 MCE family protein [Pseudonocardia oceani]MBW0121464.1 MCE family protein [Pseudonocardia oceani]MBW0126452.1 MCE family protein [Pseudonocardia oceani]
MATTTFRRRTPLSPVGIGILVTIVLLLLGVALFSKAQILTWLSPGDTIRANFSQDYRMRAYQTPVKIAGVPVGIVTGVERADDGSALIEIKLDPGEKDKLGSTPSAQIRATTLLGGSYYLELEPGGDRSELQGDIPVDRTSVPVELDRVAAALQPDALLGLQRSTGYLDDTLSRGGSEALQDLARTAPGTLGPAGGVLQAARGTRPEVDLTELVQGLESASRALSENNGQLDEVVTGLDVLSGVLDRRGGDIAASLRNSPETLRIANTGLRDLDGTLAELRDTAGPALPVVEELDELLDTAEPVLEEARPVIADLRGLLVDARPLVEDLVPATQDLTTVLDNLEGPVLDRVNGPVLDTINSGFDGTGPYEGGGGDNPFYTELAYMVTNLDSASALTDENGAVIGFNPGVNGGSIAGLPGVSVEQLFANLAQFQEIQR